MLSDVEVEAVDGVDGEREPVDCMERDLDRDRVSPSPSNEKSSPLPSGSSRSISGSDRDSKSRLESLSEGQFGGSSLIEKKILCFFPSYIRGIPQVSKVGGM